MVYQLPLISMILGIFLMVLPGSRPWEDLYRKYRWVELTARLKRVSVEHEVTEGSALGDLPKVRRFRVKVAMEYSPRDIFGAVARRPGFPKWLTLPVSRIFWEKSPESYTTVAAARLRARDILSAGPPKILVNPADYTQAIFFTVDIPWWSKTGIAFVLLGVFLLVVFLGARIRSGRKDSPEEDMVDAQTG